MSYPPPMVCDHCGNVDDPEQGWRCPCRAYAEKAATSPAPVRPVKRRYQSRAAEAPAPVPIRVLTLAERRAAYAPLSEVITEVVAEQKNERREGAA